MPLGTVTSFDHAQGHGYVVPDTGGPELYLHRVSIAGALRLTVAVGDRLEFETRAGGIQPEAVNVFAHTVLRSTQRPVSSA